jgi:mannose-6-phosphate isomerase-like protein (cupin superfamily)
MGGHLNMQPATGGSVNLLRESEEPYIDFTPGMRLARVITSAGSTVLGGGWIRMDGTGSLDEWQLPYDEVLYVIEGQITIDCKGESITASAGQALLLAHGNTVTFRSPGEALGFFVLYPRDWSERRDNPAMPSPWPDEQ